MVRDHTCVYSTDIVNTIPFPQTYPHAVVQYKCRILHCSYRPNDYLVQLTYLLQAINTIYMVIIAWLTCLDISFIYFYSSYMLIHMSTAQYQPVVLALI